MVKDFRCRFCSTVFTTRQAYGGHMNRHWREKAQEKNQRALMDLALKNNGGRLPFPMPGTSTVGQAGRGSPYVVPSFNSNLQPPLGQSIPFPSQNGHANTAEASILFRGLPQPQPQLGPAYRSGLNIAPLDIRSTGNLISVLPSRPPGMVTHTNLQCYPVSSCARPQQFHNASQNFQQRIVNWAPPVNVESQQFQQTPDLNFRSRSPEPQPDSNSPSSSSPPSASSGIYDPRTWARRG